MAFLLVGCAKQFESARRNMAQPFPLSAPCAADEVAATTEAGSRAESFVIVSGSDLRKASVAVIECG